MKDLLTNIRNVIPLLTNSNTQKNNQLPTLTPGLAHKMPSLELVFQLTKECLASQEEKFKSLNDKANLAQGSATALVSTGLILQAGLVQAHSNCAPFSFLQAMPASLKLILPLFPLLLVYIVVIIVGIGGSKLSVYLYPVKPETLLDDYLERDVNETMEKVLKAMVFTYRFNEQILAKKARWVKYTLIALAIESFRLVPTLLLQASC